MWWMLFIGAGMVSWGLCHPVGRWLRKQQTWDLPNSRSSHEKPVLRGGGFAALVVVVLALGVWVCSSEPLFGVAWIWAVLLLGYVSFKDDQGEVPIHRRLAVQIFVSVGVLFTMAGSTPPAWQLALAVFVLVAFTNYVNFMDGINGLVPGQLILMSVGSALLCGTAEWESGVPVIIALVLAGALTGFLPFNFPSPKMFMGDIGSVSLGFSFGVLIFWMAVLGQDKDLGYSLLPLTAYFFLEGSVAILRRMWRREKWWQPHREHFYQRLVRSGWSHARTTGTIWVLQCVVTALACWQFRSGWSSCLLWLTTVLVWGGFFLYVELVFRRRSQVVPN
jgi:UDP-N-acetylmuramyl pentapeptide phosphotransferase/UDP-N-acetylglucosamine-1-phosphate transferase